MSGRSRGGRKNRPHPYSDGPGSHSKAQGQTMPKDYQLLPLRRGVEIDAGDLSGEVVEPVRASFTYFGKRFRVNPDLTETAVVDLLEAGNDVEVGDLTELIAVKDYARGHIHPEDFDEFWLTAVSHRQGIVQIMQTCATLLERITDRPTMPPSGSSDGRRDTPTSSPGGASGPVIESEAIGPDPMSGNARDVGRYFIEKFEAEGRPDKAAQIAIALEAREARGLVTV